MFKKVGAQSESGDKQLGSRGRYRQNILFLLIYFLTPGVSVGAADPQLNFTALTSADGLSSNTVHAILKDRQGILWFGTDDGLNKYDGTEFTIYRNDRANPASIASNDISSLHEDKAGRIWVGTIQGALNLYDRKKDSFKRIFVNESVSSITSDHAGKLWVGTIEGLVWVDPETLKVTRLARRADIPVEVKDQLVLSFYEDRVGQMWVGTVNGLFVYDFKKDRFRKVIYNPNAQGRVKTIGGDRSGSIWIGTFKGLHKLDTGEKLLQTFQYQASDAQTISSNMIYDVVAENAKTLWVCTDGGLDVIDIETGKVTRHAPDPRNRYSLTNKSVRTILIDNRGIIWLGTYKGGVNKIDKNLTFFGLKYSDTYDTFGLSAPFVTSFAENKNGDIYVGTDGGGLNLFHRKTNLFTKIPLLPKNKLATSGLAVLTLKMAGDKLWIGTFQDGLFEMDVNSGNYRQFTQNADISSLGNNDIFCLTTDRTGKLWVGTNGGGVNVFDPRTQKFDRLFDENIPVEKRDIPLNGYIRDILQDKNGRIWIGSHGSGLVIYDTERKKSIHYDKLNSALPGNNVLSIFEDRNGDIWAGTGGEGLAKFDVKTRKFSVFGQKEGLISGVINKILEDAQGRIWVSTNQGVSYLDPATKKFVNYSQLNGLQDDTFVLGAGIRSRDDLLFFGGIKGFNYLDTRTLRQNNSPIPVVLKELRVGNKSITPADSNVLAEHISVAKSIHLDYKQNFTLTYAALNFSDASHTMYRYRLHGFDEEWHDAGLAKTAGYTNLNPGTYHFEVQAKNQNGDWNSPGKSVEIVVEPPFYMTVYAYVFYILAAFGAVLLLRHRGIQKLKRKFREEEMETEARRKRELDELKIKFLTNLSHEFRTPISLILAPLDQLLSRGAENTPLLQGIKRNARRLLNLVDQLLDFKNLQQHESQLETAPGEIVSFVRETAGSFQYLSQAKEIEYVIESEIDSLNMDFDANKIERIVLNLLSNAFKHTRRGGNVTLGLSQAEVTNAGKYLYIKVSDTGVGIPADKHEKIFERFFQNDSSTVLNQGSGIGLSIVKEFVQMHGGLIKVESAPGAGSTFTVGLPCKMAAISATSDINKPAILEESMAQEPAALTIPAAPKPLPELSADILIIEDNDEFRHYLRSNLEINYKIIEAANGLEGWQKVLAQHPQIVISDVAMPVMDGIHLSQKIKSDKRTAHIPVILLTASTGEEHELRGLSSGANDYLTKPFNFEILNAKINNLLLLNRLSKNTYSKQIDISKPEPEIISGNEKLLKNILVYIDENLTNSAQLSVEKMSRQLGLSRGTLYSKLLEMTGQTPIEFIKTIKLEKAALLLEKSDMNVSQISYATGFATPNYFAKSFKAKFNMLPSEYILAKRKSQPVDE